MRHEHVESFTVVGITVRTSNALEVTAEGKIGPLWKRFFEAQLGNAIEGQIGDDIFAVYTAYAGDETDDYTFILGYRVAEGTTAPDGFRSVAIERGDYSVLTADSGPAWSVVPAAWKTIWSADHAALGGRRAFKTDYEVHHSASATEIFVGIEGR